MNFVNILIHFYSVGIVIFTIVLRLDLFEVEVKFVLLEGLDTLGAFSEISTSTTDKHTSETFFLFKQTQL